MKSKRQAKAKRTWVVKVGSAIIVDGGPMLLRSWMQQLEELRRRFNIEVIWVTSGAIAAACQRFQKQSTELPDKQALSAIGQPMVMDLYNLALQAVGRNGAQVLLTYEDIVHKSSRLNLKNTLERPLSWNFVPILNENDAVATEEIQFGDNDLLSSKVADLMKVERLVILTNVEGLYDRDPSSPEASLVHHLTKVTPALLKTLDPKVKSKTGRGSMFSKIRAAAHAQRAKIDTWIARGDMPKVLVRIAEGEAIGTHIGINQRPAQFASQIWHQTRLGAPSKSQSTARSAKPTRSSPSAKSKKLKKTNQRRKSK